MLGTRDTDGYVTDLVSALGECTVQWKKQMEDKETGQHVITYSTGIRKGLCGLQRKSKERMSSGGGRTESEPPGRPP